LGYAHLFVHHLTHATQQAAHSPLFWSMTIVAFVAGVLSFIGGVLLFKRPG
jgi:hypothetical protein